MKPQSERSRLVLRHWVLLSRPAVLGFNVQEWKGKPATVQELLHGGWAVQQLRCKFTASQLKDAGFTLRDLCAEPLAFAAQELRQAGFVAMQLNGSGFTLKVLKTAGFTALELKEAGFSLRHLCESGFDVLELKGAQFSATQLNEVGFTVRDMKGAGGVCDGHRFHGAAIEGRWLETETSEGAHCGTRG